MFLTDVHGSIWHLLVQRRAVVLRCRLDDGQGDTKANSFLNGFVKIHSAIHSHAGISCVFQRERRWTFLATRKKGYVLDDNITTTTVMVGRMFESVLAWLKKAVSNLAALRMRYSSSFSFQSATSSS